MYAVTRDNNLSLSSLAIPLRDETRQDGAEVDN